MQMLIALIGVCAAAMLLWYVYMTAGANKFLRIYYGRVKEYLSSLPES